MSAETVPTLSTSARWSPMERDVADALDRARIALRSPEHRPLDAVVWASAHLAAFDRAVLPVVRRSLPDGRAVVAEMRRHAGRVEHALRLFERLHSGDVGTNRVDGVRLRRALLDLVTDHARLERVLLSRLALRLDETDQAALLASYHRSLEHAPTRPHPHAPRRGPLGTLAFRLDATRDRMLDVMDARHVPSPRVARPPVRAGRWSLWLLGQQRSDVGPGSTTLN
jgi:hypothetical protein